MAETTIVICYQAGTAPMMDACLASIARHSESCDFELLVLAANANALAEVAATDGWERMNGIALCVGSVVPVEGAVTKAHGAMLDGAIPEQIETPYILTLDSDCFPVADGWLDELVGMVKNPEVGCAGILHPWAPPSSDMAKNKLEWRVRSQHCWNNTHVACQIAPVAFLMEHGLKYGAGDDTGLEVPRTAWGAGLRVEGFKPTRCPNSSTDFDAELNRYVSVVFGDKVYHHGGYTRTSVHGDDHVFNASFGWVQELVVAYRGAEFLLEDENSYQYRFDREEEVAAEKMQRLFGLRDQRMSDKGGEG